VDPSRVCVNYRNCRLLDVLLATASRRRNVNEVLPSLRDGHAGRRGRSAGYERVRTHAAAEHLAGGLLLDSRSASTGATPASAPGPPSGSSSSSEAQAPVSSSHAKTAVAGWRAREPSSSGECPPTRKWAGPRARPRALERIRDRGQRASSVLRAGKGTQSRSSSAGTRALKRFAALPSYAGRPRRTLRRSCCRLLRELRRVRHPGNSRFPPKRTRRMG